MGMIIVTVVKQLEKDKIVENRKYMTTVETIFRLVSLPAFDGCVTVASAMSPHLIALEQMLRSSHTTQKLQFLHKRQS